MHVEVLQRTKERNMLHMELVKRIKERNLLHLEVLQRRKGRVSKPQILEEVRSAEAVGMPRILSVSKSFW